MVPPVGIVPRVLHYMKCQYAVGTLVVPFWPSAHYWSLIMHRYGDSLVAHVIRAGREVLIHGRNHNSLLGSHQFTGYIITLRWNLLSNNLDLFIKCVGTGLSNGLIS